MHLLFHIFLLFLFQNLSAQQQKPLIKASSKQIKILDGEYLQDGELVPELNPDTYVYHSSSTPRQLIYYTDADSISFTIQQSETYHFAIILNNTDTCYQKITSENPKKVQYIRASSSDSLMNDTIPFVLGVNNAIHIKGKINSSIELDLIFDTGASIGVLTEEGVQKKAALNSDNRNEFEVAGIKFKNSTASFIDYHGRLQADGVLGYNAFEDKIVEINYDKKIMVIHHHIKDDIGKGYSQTDMIWHGSAMFIKAALHVKNQKHNGLFLFDTGSKWALSLNKAYAAENQLYDIMEKTGTRRAKGVDGKTIKSHTVLLPQLTIVGFSALNVPIDLEMPGEGQGLAFNILGNDVLKRFNVILDYKNGVVYLQPNSLTHAPYNKSFDEATVIIVICVVLALIVSGFVMYKKYRSTRINNKQGIK